MPQFFLVPKLYLGMPLFAKLHFAVPGHGPGEEKRRHGHRTQKSTVPSSDGDKEVRT